MVAILVEGGAQAPGAPSLDTPLSGVKTSGFIIVELVMPSGLSLAYGKLHTTPPYSPILCGSK